MRDVAIKAFVGFATVALCGAAGAQAQTAQGVENVGVYSGRVECPGLPSQIGECAQAPVAVEGAGSASDAAGVGTPIVRVQGSGKFEYDNNPLMQSSGAESVFGFIATPRATVITATDASRLEFGGQVEVNQYDDSAFNSNDLYFNFNGSHKFLSSLVSLKSDFSYDTTRTSEVTETGLSVAGVRHTRFSIAPHFETKLTPLDTAFFDASALISKYDDLNYYTNYRTYTVTPGIRRSLTETQSGSLSVQGMHYESTSGAGVDIDTVIPTLGWSYQFLPRWNLDASAGAQYSITDYERESATSRDGDKWDYSYSVGLGYTDQTDKLNLAFSRRPTSLATGSQAQATSVNFTGTHTISPLIDLKLRLAYQNSERSGSNSSGSNDITFIEAAPELVYRLTEKLYLNLMYRHREREVGNTDATSDAVMLTLTFRPDEFRID